MKSVYICEARTKTSIFCVCVCGSHVSHFITMLKNHISPYLQLGLGMTFFPLTSLEYCRKTHGCKTYQVETDK